jgi:phosphatidylinositol kinase/protein kinase (PI-3  family)
MEKRHPQMPKIIQNINMKELTKSPNIFRVAWGKFIFSGNHGISLAIAFGQMIESKLFRRTK